MDQKKSKMNLEKFRDVWVIDCTALIHRCLFFFQPSLTQDGISEAIWNEYSKVENWIVEAVLQVWADRCSHGARTENLLWGYHFNIREGEVPH